MSKFCSIIMTHHSSNNERSDMMTKSILSLIDNTKYPYELIVVDNGGNKQDSEFLLALADRGDINTYVRNSNNMHFAYARNQGLELAQGDYIAIVDNDILYEPGWLTECVDVLEAFPTNKYYSTPLDYPTKVMDKRYLVDVISYKDKDYILSMRAGSNCFVIKRSNFIKIGKFPIHRIAGSVWTDRAVRSGYCAVVIPGDYATDIGLRRGYNLQDPIPVRLDVHNGESIYFNTDEFLKRNPDVNIGLQKTFK